MAEQKTSKEEEQSKSVNKPRKKVSTGPWWKSTTTEETTVTSPSHHQETESTSEKAGQEPADPSDSKVTPGSVAVTDVKEIAAEVPAPQPKKRGPGRPRKTTSPKQTPTEEAETMTAAVEGKSGEPAAESQPQRKRGRPRKKPAESGAGGGDVQTAELQPEETKPAAKSGGRRQPRAKKTGQPPEAATAPAVAEVAEKAAGEQPAQRDEQPSARQEAPPPAKPRKKPERKQEAGEEGEQRGRGAAEQEKKQQAKPEHKPVIKLLINAEEPEECRLALLEDGRLESIHVATSTRTQTKNNIYKAKIVAIEPNLQAAFVDYGTEKNGFLPFSEIHPEYYKENVSDKVQQLIDQHQWKKLSITDVMERGREVLVQVVKEEVGKKGANMTTYLSLPGRCVVLMPGSDSTGISRKISGEEQRSQLREHMLSMKIPEGIGWIVRTASVDITKTALARDVNYLINLWEEVKKKGQELEGVGLIYQDHDHVLRFLREHFDPDIQEILVDDENALDQVKAFVELLPAKQRQVRCKLHKGSRPIFNQYSIEDQIESIYQPQVSLPSGGSIVIDPTEALVAIDVNSGSTQKGKNFEDTIFQANMEAATELARQLRLRDLGGLIVVDFIDMRSKKNTRDVEKQVKTAMKRDKAKVDISRISKFGLMQISRQKLGAPIEAGNYRVCESCKGRGVVRSVETMALFYLRRIHTAASRKLVRQIECRFPLDVAGYLLNNKRQELRDLELKYDTEVVITADPSLTPGEHDIVYHKTEKDNDHKNRS